ncbi:MAG: GGDEF domain-containing protein, partial [Clostridia bacterium]|nr:GGDEF domain-containing protein [Clostridia bacterium]
IPDFEEALLRRGVIEPDSVEHYRAFFASMHAGEPSGSCDLCIRGDDDARLWNHVDYTLLYDAEGRPSHAIISFYDNSDTREKEIAYQKWQSSLAALLAENAIYLEINLSQDRIEREENLGPENAGRTGQRLSDYVAYGTTHITWPEDVEDFRAFFDRERLLGLYYAGRTMDQLEYRAIIGGQPQWFRADVQMVKYPYTDDVKAFVIYTNIDASRREREELAAAAERDSMTGLYNHATTERRIREKLAQDTGERCALLILDLDDLKSINDTQGHAEGDRALMAVAGILQKHFRSTDIIGRIGGDEFLVLLTDISSAATLRGVMDSLVRKVSEARVGLQNRVALHCSVGIAFGMAGLDDFETLYRQADRALYYIKRSGKNDFAFYISEMEQQDYQYTPHAAVTMVRTEWYESKEFKKLLSALASVFPLVISVNLTKNSYYMMEYAHFATHKSKDAGVFDELIASGVSTFHPDDQASFIDRFSRENLLRAYAA